MHVHYICVNTLYGTIFLLSIYYFDFFFTFLKKEMFFWGFLWIKNSFPVIPCFSDFLVQLIVQFFHLKFFWVFGLSHLTSKVIHKLYT